MDLTTYGYKKPGTPDTGESFFPALDFDIDRLDGHSHNGVDSTLLPTNSVSVTKQNILAGAAGVNWGSADSDGLYSQEITLPFVGSPSAQLLWEAISVQFRDHDTQEVVYAKAVETAASKYRVYVNDNSINLQAIYSS